MATDVRLVPEGDDPELFGWQQWVSVPRRDDHIIPDNQDFRWIVSYVEWQIGASASRATVYVRRSWEPESAA